MIRYICKCGYVYNFKYGDLKGEIEKGVAFKDLPDTWKCPICRTPKDEFIKKEKKSKQMFKPL